MNRRQLLALLATPALAALLHACGSDEARSREDRGGDPSRDPSSDPDAAGLARSSVPRTSVGAAEAAAASAAIERFGIDLYRRLAAASPGNVVVSPVSIATALTMVLAGARGATSEEMVRTLRIEDPSTIHRAMNALTAELARRSSGEVTLAVSNSLWAQRGLAIESPFLDTLAAEYGSGLQLVDYVGDPDGARIVINDWVDDQTEGRIPELLADGAITPDARLTVVNAVYLKAPWLVQFDPAATRPGPFTTTGGETVEVPMMTMVEPLPYAAGDGWQAVELPYVGGGLALLLLLPEPDFLHDFEQIFLLTDATNYLAPAEVRLTMPRFDIESALPLGDLLQTLGMQAAFTDDADFSGITVQEPLKIGAVIHQANITVDEAGTEAAAATAVIMETAAAPADPAEPVEVRLDRPFVFALRDTTTGALLFLGRVGAPAGA